MPNKLKVGIVGANRGSSYFRQFGTIAETDVVAVCDINEASLQNLAERFNVPNQFTDYTQMLDAVDLVVLATPENLHVPQSIEALDAGKHVISEVTAAVKLEECYDLVRAVRKSYAKYTMAENTCYSKHNVLIRTMYSSVTWWKKDCSEIYILVRESICITSNHFITMKAAIQHGVTTGR